MISALPIDMSPISFKRMSVGPSYIQKSRLRKLAKVCLITVSEELRKYRGTGVGNIITSMRTRIKGEEIIISSKNPGFQYVVRDEQTQKPSKITGLKKRTIPISLKYLRNPTARDIRQGVGFRVISSSPQHKGLIALRPFVERGVERAHEILKQEAVNTLVKRRYNAKRKM